MDSIWKFFGLQGHRKDRKLLRAASDGDIEAVRSLLDNHANVNVKDKKGKSPLYWASAKGYTGIAKTLLTRSASVKDTNLYGSTPLHAASENGHVDIVKELLSRGASVEWRDNDGDTALHLASSKSHLDIVKHLVAKVSSVDFQDNHGRTPLHDAASTNCDIVKLLLERGASVNAVDKDGETPLFKAATHGSLDCVKELLANGAAVDMADKEGSNPLLMASVGGYLDVVNELLSHGASVNVKHNNGATPLHLASFKGYVDIVQTLLDKGASVDISDKFGRTALHNASMNRNEFEELLVRGASVDVSDKDHETSLVVSFDGNLFDRMLCHCSTSNTDGNTPLLLASKYGSLDCVMELLACGASVEVKNNEVDTPLHVASLNGHLEIVLELLNHSASINVANKSGNTALHYATLRGNFDIAKLLLDAGANKLLKNQLKKTPRDLGNHKMKVFIDDYRPQAKITRLDSATENAEIEESLQPISTIYSFQEASNIIIRCLDDFNNVSSEIVKAACETLHLILSVQVQRECIFTTGLMVESILRHMQQHGYQNQLLSALKNINQVLGAKIVSINLWKFQLTEIQEIRAEMTKLQNGLRQVTEDLQLSFNAQVVGKIQDFRQDNKNMMDKLDRLDSLLESTSIAETSEPRQKKDLLVDLLIQLQRGLDHYERQLSLGNIQRDDNFENQVERSYQRVEAMVKNITTPSLEKVQVESWMLSSDDVKFDPNDSVAVLGRGGFATVYRGRYYGQNVAVKCFDQVSTMDSSDLESIICKEITTWKSISKEPHILTLVGVCTKTPAPIVVSELCETNIRRYVRDWPESLFPLVYQFACGLASLHAAKIIHRDLKGDNVLVTFQRTVAIADFGLSRSVTSPKTPKANKRAGTLNWMSPEQYFEPQTVTTKSDVWSFGMTLWEILCNETPLRRVRAAEFEESVFKSEDDRPEKPEDMDPAVKPLWTLITNCWRLNPDDRPSADKIVEFLQSHYDSQVEKF
ncbi:hypothetical protein AeMF1_005532 [Aphanomyces euteiches]|nr:hypothetical protein AeMF1_005532 [Aphanomyces euteiches]KAH9184978.1 hypothetical protein AeNC1_013047 [Aphanomyces euteiches]